MFALGALHVIAAAILLNANLALRTLPRTPTTATEYQYLHRQGHLQELTINHAINCLQFFTINEIAIVKFLIKIASLRMHYKVRNTMC